MALKRLINLRADKYITIGGVDKKTGKKNPTELEGYYLGAERRPGNGKFGQTESVSHNFLTNNGTVGVWEKTDLRGWMKTAKPGSFTRVEYRGMVATKNGEMHKYEVFGDDENKMDLGGLNTEFDADPIEATTDEEESEDTEDYEAPAPVVSDASAAERKAKVDALLNRKSK